MDANLSDIRVAPIKISTVSQPGYASPRRNLTQNPDPGPLYKSVRNFSRTKSLRDSADDVYEAEFGGPAERSASRPSSRVKGRVVKDARAELLGLDEALHNVGNRELRSKSSARVKGSIDVEMDDAENGSQPEVPKSRSSSRMKARSSRDQGDLAGLQEAVQGLGDRELRSISASRTRNGTDVAEVDGSSYASRSLHATPRLTSRNLTPRVPVRSSREQEETRNLQEAAGEKELRTGGAARRLLLNSDSQDDALTGHGDRIPYRVPTKSSLSARENTDSPEERLLRVERLSRKQGRSPRQARGEATDMVVETTLALTERGPRRNVRKAELEGVDDGEDGTGPQRRGRVARQHKRKVRDTREPTPMLPVSHPPECEMPDQPPVQPLDPLSSSPTSSRRSTREPSTSRSITWLRILGDLIMWRDIPRSALWFGAGSFVILSASFMQDMQCGMVAISANLALFYLAVVFFYRTFLRGFAELSSGNEKSFDVTEADLLRWIQVLLPAVNLALRKVREVFSGDPATTLRVAAILWLVAKGGSRMSLWSFLRFGISRNPIQHNLNATDARVHAILFLKCRMLILNQWKGLCMAIDTTITDVGTLMWVLLALTSGYFALFTIPKCQASYSSQLCAIGQSSLVRAWITWDGFAHKKATIVGAVLLAWNLSSFSTRLWGAFMLVVWLRLYQQSHPASFEKALSDASCSAVDHIESQGFLSQAKMSLQAAQSPVIEGCSILQTKQVQTFPDREVNGVTYKA